MGFFSDIFLDSACVHIHDGSSRNGGVALDKREERDSRDVCEAIGKGRTGETGKSSRFEIRGFRNFEPRTSNFLSPPSRLEASRHNAG